MKTKELNQRTRIVKISENYFDKDGNPMIKIGGAYYPESLAETIAHEILILLEYDEWVNK